MSNDDTRTVHVLICLLLLICACLLYVDWRQSGEIELLHERVDAVDGRPVARILRAHDDATAERIAREGTTP